MFRQNNTLIRFGFFAFFGLIYLLLPTQNSSLDGYAYAHMIRSGDMFMHHHLLYNALGFSVVKSLNFIGFHPDVLALMKVVNALFAVGCLWVLFQILVYLKKMDKEALALTALAGSCFGLMRFATENENYIIPIFFSLLGSLYLLYYLENNHKKNIILASLILSVACLFHQVHVWWWLAGLLVFIRKRNVIYYLLPAMIVPIVYAVVVVKETGSIANFIDYVFYDYLHGSASIAWAWMDIPLAGISLVRSFVQVHGSMAIQVQHSSLWVFPSLMSAGLLFYSFWGMRKWKFRTDSNNHFFRFICTAFILHLGFAELCHGNAEFMVMLPLLIILALASMLNIPAKNLWFAAFATLVWNLNFGLLPAHIYNFENKQKQAAFIHQHPETHFVANDYWYAWNVYKYIYAKEPGNLYSGIDNGAKPLNPIKWKTIFTDKCNIRLVLNRKALVDPKTEETAFMQSDNPIVDSIVGYWGVQYIYKIEGK